MSGGLPTSVTHNYQYDATGNLLDNGGTVYTYSDPAHPAAVTSTTTGWSFTYDANGNMLTGAGRASSWDADNRLTSTTIQGGNTAAFGYDHTGTRVRKTTSAGVTRYPFPSYEIGPDGTVTKYVRLGDAIHAAKKGTQRLFYHPDHLGGVHVISDINGVAIQLTEYAPWGMVARSEGTAETARRFTGKELDDPEVGLLYYGGRYYWAALGRFMSADPFVPAPGNPQNLNRYAYVLNNPVNFIDPTGYFWKSLKKWFRFHTTYIVPTAAGIVVGIFGGPIAGGAVAAGMSAGISTAWAGGSLGDVALASTIGGAIGATAGYFGGAAGTAVGTATGNAAAAAIAGGAVGGAISGGLNAAIYGGDIGQSILYGAVTGAVISAAIYAGYQGYNRLSAFSRQSVTYGDVTVDNMVDVTSDPTTAGVKARWQELTGRPTGERYIIGDFSGPGSNRPAFHFEGTVYFNRAFVPTQHALTFGPGAYYFGHETQHAVQYYRSPRTYSLDYAGDPVSYENDAHKAGEFFRDMINFGQR